VEARKRKDNEKGAADPKSKTSCGIGGQRKRVSLGDADLESVSWGRSRRKKSSRGRKKKKKKSGFFERGKKMAAEKANKVAQAAKKARQMVAEKAGKAKRAAEKARKSVAEKAGKVKRAATEKAKKVKQAAVAKAAKVAAMAKKAAEKAKKVKQAAVARAKKMKEVASKKVKKVKAMVKNPLQSLAKGGLFGGMLDKAIDMILKRLRIPKKARPNIKLVITTGLTRGIKAAIKEVYELYLRCPSAFFQFTNYIQTKVSELKNRILVGMGINPCQVACIGRLWFTPVFDYRFPLVVRPAVAKSTYGIISDKMTDKARGDMGDEFPTERGKDKALKLVLAMCSLEHPRTRRYKTIPAEPSEGRLIEQKEYDCEEKNHICAMEFTWFTPHCHTCCCKGGLLKRYIGTKLIADNAGKFHYYHVGDNSRKGNCKKWFMLYDNVIRTFLSTPISLVLPSFIQKAGCKNFAPGITSWWKK